MKKGLLGILFAVMCCIFAITPADAGAILPRVVDNANLLSETEEMNLLRKLDQISERQQLDIVVVTTDTLEGKTPTEYADDFYDYNGFGFGDDKDGVLLLVSMEDRDWHITTTGYGITAFTDAGIDYIGDTIVEDLGDGEYYSAFDTYADLCDEFITQARSGEPYDIGNMPKEAFPLFRNILIALAVGLVIGLIVVSTMKAQLKTVRVQKSATNYTKQGSMNVTDSREMFLYANVTRQEKVQNSSSGGGSSTHTSSSGTSHGGGGGKF